MDSEWPNDLLPDVLLVFLARRVTLNTLTPTSAGDVFAVSRSPKQPMLLEWILECPLERVPQLTGGGYSVGRLCGTLVLVEPFAVKSGESGAVPGR